jgi:phosphoribosylanthranilate isomerase
MGEERAGKVQANTHGYRPLVKICGITNRPDALAADAHGADYLGMILSDGFGRSVSHDQAAEIMCDVRATRVAVVVDEVPAAAAARARALGATVIQLHGHEDRACIEALRELGEWTLWKAVRARSVDDVLRAVEDLGHVVDGVLVEGWREGVTGGGGVHVALSADDVRASVPDGLTFVLAGGLTVAGVPDAVARFGPDVVDVSSGVEQRVGMKDSDLVGRFIAAVRSGS